MSNLFVESMPRRQNSMKWGASCGMIVMLSEGGCVTCGEVARGLHGFDSMKALFVYNGERQA